MKALARSIAVLAAVMAAAAPASAQTITIVNRANVSPARIIQVQRALRTQVARDLRATWRNVRPVKFGPGGWQIRLVSSINPQINKCFCYAFHDFTRASGPYAVVGVGGFYAPWSVSASHELLEMLVDPHANGREIADPVETVTYDIAGVSVSDAVTPAWFMTGSHGPWDLRHQLTAPRQNARRRLPFHPVSPILNPG